MARLVVRVAGGTGFGTEALAIAHNSLDNLNLTGATGAGTGANGRHHIGLTDFCIGQNGRNIQKDHILPTQLQYRI